jgi:ABC-type dipeptide/oligopeptide/nickel transport system permease component
MFLFVLSYRTRTAATIELAFSKGMFSIVLGIHLGYFMIICPNQQLPPLVLIVWSTDQLAQIVDKKLTVSLTVLLDDVLCSHSMT